MRKFNISTQTGNIETANTAKAAKLSNMTSEPTKNWIVVEINNRRKKVMVDTGAARSVMDLKTLLSVGMTCDQLQ